MKKIILLFLSVFVLLSLASAQLTKQVLPTKALVKWANSEIGVLIHFDLQVFEPTYNFRKDWNYHPDLSIFNPKELDTDQWIRAAKSMGATYVVLVAKHCSGFSLWPTKAHPYSVKNTPWRNGQGDILKDFMASCKKFGLKPGIYASTTANGYLKVDNPGKVVSHNAEEQKKYNEIVKLQLTELWSQYGELFEVWFDGGVLPPEKGGFDILSLLKKYQPKSLAFQGPYGYENNIRWVGNENGVAPYPCWARADSTTSASGLIERVKR
jgi:alpha-L-fucosidase